MQTNHEVKQIEPVGVWMKRRKVNMLNVPLIEEKPPIVDLKSEFTQQSYDVEEKMWLCHVRKDDQEDPSPRILSVIIEAWDPSRTSSLTSEKQPWSGR